MSRMNNADNPLLLAALWCAQRGWPVFPCAAKKKRPLTKHGFKDATCDKAQIIQWWTNTPNANLGIATGDVAGVVVLDIDPRNGGDESLSELERINGPMPSTLMAETGGGGRHLFLQLPPGSSAKCRVAAEGIDFKATGGYVIGAGSVHPSGGLYRWCDATAELAECPNWLLTEKASAKAATVPVASAEESKLGKAFKRAGLLKRELGDGKWAVECPWLQEHSTASDERDTSTVIFPAKTPGGLGGFDCKHSHCVKRKASDALRTLKRKELTSDAANSWKAELVCTDKGEVRTTFGNVVLVLRNDATYGEHIRSNEMRGVISFGTSELTDAAVSTVRVDLERRYAMYPKDSETLRAIQLVAHDHSFHPVRDYLNGLTWDGTPRLLSFAREILHVRAETPQEDRFLSMLGYRWFISLVARVFKPGCQVDTALILQGAQGIGKSSFFRAIAGEWFSDTEMALDKDAMMQLRSTWIYEWAELENITGRHAVSQTKAFLSSSQDSYRPPFGRATVTVKRSGVIVGTTNRETFLHDSSGSRRFWVLPVGNIDVARAETLRDQLLAEACMAYRREPLWWLNDAEDKVRARLAARYSEVDAWEEDVLTYAEGQQYVRTENVLKSMNIPVERRDRGKEMRVAAILQANGYRRTQRKVEGKNQRYWYRP